MLIFKNCNYCKPPDASHTEEISDKAHPAQNAVDGDTTTWWQSPTISRGLNYNRVTLSIDLQQVQDNLKNFNHSYMHF
jgi:hypothetical protein